MPYDGRAGHHTLQGAEEAGGAGTIKATRRLKMGVSVIAASKKGPQLPTFWMQRWGANDAYQQGHRCESWRGVQQESWSLSVLCRDSTWLQAN
jgi:hypothetical protein